MLDEIFGFLSVVFGILGVLYIPYVLFIKPAYRKRYWEKNGGKYWVMLSLIKTKSNEMKPMKGGLQTH